MKTIYKTILAISPIVLIAVPVFAQGGPPATPIDGGLSFLLAAGGAYGIKRLMKNKKED